MSVQWHLLLAKTLWWLKDHGTPVNSGEQWKETKPNLQTVFLNNVVGFAVTYVSSFVVKLF